MSDIILKVTEIDKRIIIIIKKKKERMTSIGQAGKVLFREKKSISVTFPAYFLHSVEVVTSVIIAMRLLLSDANKIIM